VISYFSETPTGGSHSTLFTIPASLLAPVLEAPPLLADCPVAVAGEHPRQPLPDQLLVDHSVTNLDEATVLPWRSTVTGSASTLLAYRAAAVASHSEGESAKSPGNLDAPLRPVRG